MPHTEEFRVIFKNNGFVSLGETFPSNLSFSMPLSAVGDIAFDISVSDLMCHESKIFPKKTDYVLMLGNEPLTGGIIMGLEISDVESEAFTVTGNDYLVYLEHRWFPFDPLNLAGGGYAAPVNTDVFTIVEQMLTTTLAKDHSLPLTYNNGLSGQTINDFKIPLGDTEDIKSKIEGLSKKARFDYEITWDRKFKMYPDGKGVVKTYTFEQGKNIFLLNYSNQGPEATHTLGVAQGSGNKLARAYDHISGLETYRRWDSHSDLPTLNTTDVNAVQDATTAEAERNISPRLEFSCVFVGEEGIDILHTVDTGDRVPVYADLEWIVVDDLMRIVNIQCQADDEGNPEVTLTFDDGTIPQ